MGKLVNRLFGLLMPDMTAQRDAPAAATPPMLIEGARAAKELCMLPTDANLPSTAQMEVIVCAHAKPAPRIVQLKADGIRALYIGGRIVSREGAPLDCALHCQPGLARLEEAIGQPFVFDSEYVAQDGFNATLAEHKAGIGNGVCWVFDAMPLSDWKSGRCDIPLERRLGFLRRAIVEHSTSLFVGMLDAWTLDPLQTVSKVREIWAAGGEGVVSKRIGSPYVRARSDDWLRIKQTLTVDGRIVDMMGRPDGTLKSMIVRTDRGPITVGTGWTVTEGRALLLAYRHGQIDDAGPCWVEISFQLSTGARRAVRGARFHRIRTSKGTLA